VIYYQQWIGVWLIYLIAVMDSDPNQLISKHTWLHATGDHVAAVQYQPFFLLF